MSSFAPAILRLPDVLRRNGMSRSTIYARIANGEFPAPVSIGTRAVGWPAHEIDAIINARIAGKSDDEIRSLVAKLEDARKAAA